MARGEIGVAVIDLLPHALARCEHVCPSIPADGASLILRPALDEDRCRGVRGEEGVEVGHEGTMVLCLGPRRATTRPRETVALGPAPLVASALHVAEVPMAAGKSHTVQEGECMSSISFENGFFWKSLWNLAENADLKSTRESPFVLKPGDVVQIPELRQREVSVATGARHTFRRNGVPAVLRLQLLDMNKPLAGLPYVLEFSGKKITGTTDAQGKVALFVPPDLPSATLRVGEGERPRVYELALRTLDPAREIKGIQARLANLGYYRGGVHGDLDAATAAAIEKFQREHDLEPTGEADETTALLLADIHDASKK